MKSIFKFAQSIDRVNPRFADILDLSLTRFAYEYNNSALDDTIESHIDEIQSSRLVPKTLKKDPSFRNKAKSESTVDFLVNYYAQAFIDEKI